MSINNKKVNIILKNGFDKVSMLYMLKNIFKFCKLSESIEIKSKYNMLISVKAGFPVLPKIEELYPNSPIIKMDIITKSKNLKTRDVLYGILSEIEGKCSNPQRKYGKSLSSIYKKMKQILPKDLIILSENIDLKVVKRILTLQTPFKMKIVAHPPIRDQDNIENTRNDLKKLGIPTERAIKKIIIRDNPFALDEYSKFILPKIYNGHPKNPIHSPWHPFTPEAMAMIIDFTKGNCILFSYILANINNSLIKSNDVETIIIRALQDYLIKEVSEDEKIILNLINKNGVCERELLEEEFGDVLKIKKFKTRFKNSMRILNRKNLIQRLSVYTNNGYRVNLSLNSLLTKTLDGINNMERIEGLNAFENNTAKILAKKLYEGKELSKGKLIESMYSIAKDEYNVGRSTLEKVIIILIERGIIEVEGKPPHTKIHKLTEKGESYVKIQNNITK